MVDGRPTVRAGGNLRDPDAPLARRRSTCPSRPRTRAISRIGGYHRVAVERLFDAGCRASAGGDGVIGFALAVSLVTGLLFGLLPALRIAGTDPYDALRTSGRIVGTAGARGGLPFGRMLVVAQVAVSLVLLDRVR